MDAKTISLSTAYKLMASKEEKWAPGFKAGQDSLALLFCVNPVGFMVRYALIYKSVNL